MSQENAEIARRACKAAWRRPKSDFDVLNALAHPDHEMFTIQSLVEGGPGYRGAEGFRSGSAAGMRCSARTGKPASSRA